MSTLNVTSIQNPAAPQANISLNADGTVTLPVFTGAAAPPLFQAGTLWYNTTASALQIRNAANTTWVATASGGGGVTSVTASAPLAATAGATPDISLTGTIPVLNGGTGATTVAGAQANLLPAQTAPDAGKFLKTDGAGVLSWDTAGGGFPAGTRMAFQQTAAPTGWVKDTTYNNYSMRIVSGAVGTGGTVAFTTAFASGLSSNSYTLTTTDIPSHSHGVSDPGHAHGFSNNVWQEPGGAAPTTSPGGTLNLTSLTTAAASTGVSIQNTGGGGGHSHTLPSFDVQYVDFIIATKS